MIKLMAVMVPLVFLINGFTKHDWRAAFFFAMAVAVGLTPEMLPHDRPASPRARSL
jgi:P-type Mg2+ transporter